MSPTTSLTGLQLPTAVWGTPPTSVDRLFRADWQMLSLNPPCINGQDEYQNVGQHVADAFSGMATPTNPKILDAVEKIRIKQADKLLLAEHFQKMAGNQAEAAADRFLAAHSALKKLGYTDLRSAELLCHLMNESQVNNVAEMLEGIPYAAATIEHRVKAKGEEWTATEFVDLMIELTKFSRGEITVACRYLDTALTGLEQARVRDKKDSTVVRPATNKEKALILGYVLTNMVTSENWDKYVRETFQNLGAAISAVARLKDNDGNALTAKAQASLIMDNISGIPLTIGEPAYYDEFGCLFKNLGMIFGAFLSHRHLFEGQDGVSIYNLYGELAAIMGKYMRTETADPIAQSLGIFLSAKVKGSDPYDLIHMIGKIAADYYDNVDVAARVFVKLSRIGFSQKEIYEFFMESALASANRAGHNALRTRPQLAEDTARQVRQKLYFVEMGDPFRIRLLARALRSKPFRNSAHLLRIIS